MRALVCEDGVHEKRRVKGEVYGADRRDEIRGVQESDWGESLMRGEGGAMATPLTNHTDRPLTINTTHREALSLFYHISNNDPVDESSIFSCVT